MHRIGVHMPVWKRERLTRSVAKYHAEIDVEGVDLVLMASCTRRADVDVVKASGWGYVQAPNEPLTRKHNAGVRALKFEGVDAVVHLNSDDYLSEGYWKKLKSSLDAGQVCRTLHNQVYLLENQTPRLVEMRGAKPGSGTMIHSDVLDRMDWTPWPEQRDRYLDSLMLETVKRHLTQNEQIWDTNNLSGDGVQILGVKSDEGEQMWSVDQLMELAGNPRVLAAKPYMQRHYCRLLKDPYIQGLIEADPT